LFFLIRFHCVYFGFLFRQTISCFCHVAHYLYFFILCQSTLTCWYIFHVSERCLTGQSPKQGSVVSCAFCVLTWLHPPVLSGYNDLPI
jgi:hypothetical protein